MAKSSSSGGADALLAGLPPIPTSSGSTSYGYGLSKEAADNKFDMSGLDGFASGQLSGADLLNAFWSYGNGGSADQRTIVAAIQQALYMGRYYTSQSYVPDFGVVRPEDASALAQALNGLTKAQAAGVGSSGQKQTLVQFLTGAAAMGVQSGVAQQGQNLRQAVNIRTPNAADVAAAYQKIAQQQLGHKPTPQETQAFVQSYISNYTQVETANAQATYNAQVQAAQAKVTQAVAQGVNLPFGNSVMAGAAAAIPPTAGDLQGQGGQGHQLEGDQSDPTTGLQYPSAGPAPQLTDAMQTIQQAIAASAADGQPDLTGLTTVTKETPPALDVAAQNYARSTHPQEAAAGDVNNAFQMFLGLLSKGVGGL